MTDSTLNMETLARRLAKVEQENRRVRWAGSAVAFSLLTGATNTPTQLDRDVSRLRTLIAEAKTPKELDESGLRMLDGNGKVRAVLDMGENGPRLVLYDANEKARAGLSVDKDGPGLSLFGANETVAILAANANGTALTFHANGNVRARLNVDKDGQSGLSLFHADLKPAAVLAVLTDEGPALSLRNANGKLWRAVP